MNNQLTTAITSQGYTADYVSYQSGALVRPRYYRGQLITPEVPTLEQEYFLEKERIHNRLLHGWGVICGAQVCLPTKKNGGGQQVAPDPWMVMITTGYILARTGDLIAIQNDRLVDLRSDDLCSTSDAGYNQVDDPYCVQGVTITKRNVVYVGVKYHEEPSRPVQVSPGGCGCGTTQCEISRISDGYTICLLDTPPDMTGCKDPTQLTINDFTLGTCPECSNDPVILARVDLDDNGNIIAIDNFTYRRIVLSAAGACVRLANANFTFTITPATVTEGDTGKTLTLTFTGLTLDAAHPPVVIVDGDPGIVLNNPGTVNNNSLVIGYQVAETVPVNTNPGYPVRVVAHNCEVASGTLKVVAAKKQLAAQKAPKK